MKQVLLNLTVNALEAVRPGTGEVVIDGRRDGGWIELTVRDNGRGMDRQTLDRVFEPFYTEKRGVGEPGTGLGLSITHAIVTDHGGTLRVTSAGPGEGSEFIIRRPARTTSDMPARLSPAQNSVASL
jgi:signal transduction histidine kinase